MINWYAISAKHNLELLAAENIERQNFNTYLPKVLKKPNKKKSFNKTLYGAFFPGYLFVELDLQKDRWQKINSTIGVKKIVSIGSCPIPIPNKIIDEIKKVADENGVVRENKQFNKNEEIIIDAGLFSGSKGIFDRRVPGENRVKVLLNLMGVSTSLNINSDHIQKI